MQSQLDRDIDKGIRPGDLVRTDAYYKAQTGVFKVFDVQQVNNYKLVFTGVRLINHRGMLVAKSKTKIQVDVSNVVSVYKTENDLHKYYDERTKALENERALMITRLNAVI